MLTQANVTAPPLRHAVADAGPVDQAAANQAPCDPIEMSTPFVVMHDKQGAGGSLQC